MAMRPRASQDEAQAARLDETMHLVEQVRHLLNLVEHDRVREAGEE